MKWYIFFKKTFDSIFLQEIKNNVNIQKELYCYNETLSFII